MSMALPAHLAALRIKHRRRRPQQLAPLQLFFGFIGDDFRAALSRIGLDHQRLAVLLAVGDQDDAIDAGLEGRADAETKSAFGRLRRLRGILRLALAALAFKSTAALAAAGKSAAAFAAAALAAETLFAARAGLVPADTVEAGICLFGDIERPNRLAAD